MIANICKTVFAPFRAMPMLVRRILLIIISLIFGWVGMSLSVWYILGTTLADYGTVYIVFTVLSLALFLAIWLDHENVFNTEILPH